MSDNDVILRIYANKLGGISPFGDPASLLKGLKLWLKLSIFKTPTQKLRSLQDPNILQKMVIKKIIRDTLKDDQLYDLYCDSILGALRGFIRMLSDDELEQLVDAVLKS